jgi:hypothetical protein
MVFKETKREKNSKEEGVTLPDNVCYKGRPKTVTVLGG